MRIHGLTFLLVAIASNFGQAQTGVVENTQERARVGRIYIVGNNKTPSSEILKWTAINPADVLEYEKIRSAEEKLAKIGLFVVDPAKGIRPTVTVVENESVFKDVVINVQEEAVQTQTVPTQTMPTNRSGLLRRLLPFRR